MSKSVVLLTVGVYVGIGVALSLTTAPLSWREAVRGEGLGNIPFWALGWPIPVAAEAVKQITGEYPEWTPEL